MKGAGKIFSVFLLTSFSVLISAASVHAQTSDDGSGSTHSWMIYSFGNADCETPPPVGATPYAFEQFLRSNNMIPNIVVDKSPNGVLIDVQVQFVLNGSDVRAMYFPMPELCQAFAAIQQNVNPNADQQDLK
jgi:hypothetical protein